MSGERAGATPMIGVDERERGRGPRSAGCCGTDQCSQPSRDGTRTPDYGRCRICALAGHPGRTRRRYPTAADRRGRWNGSEQPLQDHRPQTTLAVTRTRSTRRRRLEAAAVAAGRGPWLPAGRRRVRAGAVRARGADHLPVAGDPVSAAGYEDSGELDADPVPTTMAGAPGGPRIALARGLPPAAVSRSPGRAENRGEPVGVARRL